MTVGETIKAIRIDRDLTQQDIALAAGVSDAWLSKVENNLTQTPSPKLLRAIAKPLQVEPDILLRAAGYIRTAPSLDEMSTDDLFSQINQLLREVKKRNKGNLSDGTTEKKTTMYSISNNYSLIKV